MPHDVTVGPWYGFYIQADVMIGLVHAGYVSVSGGALFRGAYEASVTVKGGPREMFTSHADAVRWVAKTYMEIKQRELVALANDAAAVARGESAELPADHGDRMLAALRGEVSNG